MNENLLFKLKVGEVGKVIEADLMDASGAFIDLTGRDVFFSMARGSSVVIDAEACVNDSNQGARPSGNRGKTRFTFGTIANTLTPGTYNAEFVVVEPDGDRLIYPNSLNTGRDVVRVIVTRSIALP